MSGKVRLIFGLLVGAAAIALILRTTDVNAVWENVQKANIALLTLSALVATLSFPLRALRWRVILQPVDPRLSYNLLWRATAVGFALNNVLPARLGEVARAYSLSREAPKVGFPAAFASLAVDRVFDAIVLVVLLVIGLMGSTVAVDPESKGIIYGSLITMTIAAGLLLVALFGLAFFPSRIIAIYAFFAGKLAPRLLVRGSALLTSFATGLSVLTSPKRFVIVLGWTTVQWLVNGLAFWIGFLAMGMQVPNAFLAALTAQSVIAFAIAVPNAPAFIGLFQVSGALALLLFGVDEGSAYAWGFAYWAFSFVPITAIGLYYFARMGLTLKEIRDAVGGKSPTDTDTHTASVPTDG